MKNRLEISDLSLAYGKRTILEHISFTLAAGEAVALCGENGSGKTTLLTAAAGILRPTHGKIRRSGKVGYVPLHARVCRKCCRFARTSCARCACATCRAA